MNIVILGPQGSGKGTQAKLLATKFKFFYFESGEFLRGLAKKNETVRKFLDSGQLVPSEEFASYVCAYLDEKEIYDNILFDGFPRELNQYFFFKKWLTDRDMKFDLAILLEVSKEVTIERLMKRKREDDTGQAIQERLEIYRNETLPLISELEKGTQLVRVDGERTIEEIQKDLIEIVAKKL